MRLATFEPASDGAAAPRVGVLASGRVVDLFATRFAMARWSGVVPAEAYRAASEAVPRDMVAFFSCGDDARRTADEAIGFALDRLQAGDEMTGPVGEPIAPDEGSVRLLAPVPRPRRVRDYLTYEAHATGVGRTLPEAFTRMPICYKCNVETIIGPDETICWPAYSDQLDFELEVGFFTGRGGRDISVADAPAHIAGVTLFNDVSARDVQRYEMSLQIGPSKGKDFCTAMGPVVLTMHEVDEYAIECAARVNGEEWARGTTEGRRFSFAEVLAWASYGETVYPGEFFAVGTVGGGCGLELDRWIQPGDVVELEASGIGVLRNPVGAREKAPPGAGLPSYTGSPRVTPPRE